MMSIYVYSIFNILDIIVLDKEWFLWEKGV